MSNISSAPGLVGSTTGHPVTPTAVNGTAPAPVAPPSEELPEVIEAAPEIQEQEKVEVKDEESSTTGELSLTLLIQKVADLPSEKSAPLEASRLAPPPEPDYEAMARARLTPPPAIRASRIVVVESPTEDGADDRLDEEFEVVARLTAPLAAEQLIDILADHRPQLMLWKQSLDAVNEAFMAACRAHNVKMFVLAVPAYGLLRPVRLRRFGGLPWLELRRSDGRTIDERIKRGVELALTVGSLPLAIPVMLLITVAVSVSGPPLYLQKRVGAGGREFRMVKFRTMRVGAERATGPALATRDDHRVTRVGRVLRRFRLDELPQLWNVLRGQMSLVGPRPERPKFVAELRRQLPDYDLRHLLRPGMTGIAQLTGGYAATAAEKLRCDLLYLHCRSLRFDLKLLVLTVVDLLRGFPRG